MAYEALPGTGEAVLLDNEAEIGFNLFTGATQAAVALLQIPLSTCATETPGSPYLLPAGSDATSVSAYPLRPF
jgi:hypothetical protein